MRRLHLLSASPLILLLALDLSLGLRAHYIPRLAPTHPNLMAVLCFLAAAAALSSAAANIAQAQSGLLPLAFTALLAAAADSTANRPLLTSPVLATLLALLVRPAAPTRSLVEWIASLRLFTLRLRTALSPLGSADSLGPEPPNSEALSTALREQLTTAARAISSQAGRLRTQLFFLLQRTVVAEATRLRNSFSADHPHAARQSEDFLMDILERETQARSGGTQS
jgi:hypothetical protein